MSLISLLDINEQCAGGIRPLREGEEYFRSGLLMCVGLKDRENDIVVVMGLAAQTSGVLQYPHEIQLKVDTSKEPGKRIVHLVCKCPAGNSGRCKHCISILIYLNRVDEHDLDDLSCTDLEQQWGAIKATHVKDFEAKPLSEFCHIGVPVPAAQSEVTVTEEMRSRWRNILINSAPLSEISLFFSGLRMCYGLPSCRDDEASQKDERRSVILKILTFKTLYLVAKLRRLTDELLAESDVACQEFYENRVRVSDESAVDIALLLQGSDEWKQGRHVRVSGAKCYSWHTYWQNRKKHNVKDWDSKFNTEYSGKWDGNDATVHGLTCEPLARDKYLANNKEELLDMSLFEAGLFVRPELPWAGFSSDGTVLNQRKEPVKIIEVKSPVEGKRLKSRELLENHCVQLLDRNGNLKTKHPHYGQVHLGMLLLGVEQADYLTYSRLENDSHVITIQFNETFAAEMTKNLCFAYFKELLPRMVRNN